MWFKQDVAISSLNDKPVKIIDQFTYLGSKILLTGNDVYICIGKLWIAIDDLLTIWKPNLADKVKGEFFQSIAISVL